MIKRIIKRILPILIIMAITISMSFYALSYFKNESKDVQEQEQISDKLAEEYLINITQQEQNNDNKEEQKNDETEPSIPSDLEYDDNEIYSYFDESYAWGKIDCVLEIPAISLRQSIFTGTVQQIEHDLRKWLPVTARTDYVLGSTHYCVYMHNPRDKSIQISKAQENLKTNDYMIVTKDNYVYLYRVTEVFAEWRNKCTDIYVNNMSTPADKFYIFTCGRGEWQGRNLVIEGTIYDVYKTNDWNINKDKYIVDYKNSLLNLPESTEPIKPDPLSMTLTAENNNLHITIKAPNFTKVDGCSISIVDEEGQPVDRFEHPIEYDNKTVVLNNLKDGIYYVGIYENSTEFSDPLPYKVNISTKQITITDVAKENNQAEEDSEIARTIAISLLTASILFGTFIIVLISVSEIRKK